MGGKKEYGYDGSIEDTIIYMKDHNISHCVILNYLPVGQMLDRGMETMEYGLPDYDHAAQEVVQKIVGRCLRRNKWSIEQSAKHPELISLINIDPRMDEDTIRQEVRERVAEGARGVNLHSFIQLYLKTNEYPVTLLDVLAEAAQPVKVLAPTHFNHPALSHLAGFS